MPRPEGPSLPQRKFYPKRRSRFLRNMRDGAAGGAYERSNDWQPEARAALVSAGGEEWLEHHAGVCLGDALAVIGDFDSR